MASYDLITGQWSYDNLNMHSHRCYVSATTCRAKIYALRGARSVQLPNGDNEIQRLATAEAYDPISNKWKMLPPMNRIRSDACAVSHAGLVYIIGGFDWFEILSSVEIHDPQTSQWTYGPSMLVRRSGLRAVVHRGKIYPMGDYDKHDRLSSVQCLDLQRLLLGWKLVAPMISKRSNFATGKHPEDRQDADGATEPLPRRMSARVRHWYGGRSRSTRFQFGIRLPRLWTDKSWTMVIFSYHCLYQESFLMEVRKKCCICYSAQSSASVKS